MKKIVVQRLRLGRRNDLSMIDFSKFSFFKFGIFQDSFRCVLDMRRQENQNSDNQLGYEKSPDVLSIVLDVSVNKSHSLN